jgi:predicted TIM-barrel fold metal-dependent hydrolase
MIIDSNVYWLPKELFQNQSLREEFIRAVPKEYDVYARAEQRESGEWTFVIEKPKGCPNLDYFEADYEMDKQLADMNAAAVDIAILKLPGCQEWLPLELCKVFNDAAAKHVEESQGRMQALAVVPPFGDNACLSELDRCIKKLGMKGVQVSAHYGNHYLDDPMFRDFFRHVNELKIPVYVHHTPIPVDSASLLNYNNLRRSFGRCQDQVTAIGRELFSGMFEELPNVKMIHSMLGGGYFTFKDMLMPRDSGGGRFVTDTEHVKKWLQENIFYELSHAQPWSKPILRAAVEILGADHIIYGSSYPVKQVWMTGGPSYVQESGLKEEEAVQILAENARKIYSI